MNSCLSTPLTPCARAGYSGSNPSLGKVAAYKAIDAETGLAVAVVPASAIKIAEP